jgi:hypothetical protein
MARTWISYRCAPCYPWCTHLKFLVVKKLFQFSCRCEQFHLGSSFGFLVINVCNHEDLCEAPPIKPSAQILRAVLNMSSRCCNSTNRSHLSSIRLKFKSKAPFKKLSNLILGLRRGPWRFWGWVALTDWSWHQGVCRQWVERERSSRNWTGNYEDACLIWGDSKGTEEGFVSSDFGVWFLQDMPGDSCIATCIVGQWRWWYWWPACSPRGSASSLNRRLFARFNTICKVFVNTYIMYM